MQEAKLLDQRLVVRLQLTKGVDVDGRAVGMKVLDVPEGLRKRAELQLINKAIFDLI